MATIQRPLKEGSGAARTYQEKVGLGFVDILASEMDGDLDTIYSAWNGGVDSVTLKDLAVTTAKLADLAVTTPKLADGAVTGIKIAKGNTIFAQNSTSDGGAVTLPNNALGFVGQLSLAVDVNRPVLMSVRIYFDLQRVTSGATGQSFTVQTNIGGTSGVVDGTTFSSEELAFMAVATSGEYHSFWYPFSTVYTPTVSPLLWKILVLNPNTALYVLRKRNIAIQMTQLA